MHSFNPLTTTTKKKIKITAKWSSCCLYPTRKPKLTFLEKSFRYCSQQIPTPPKSAKINKKIILKFSLSFFNFGFFFVHLLNVHMALFGSPGKLSGLILRIGQCFSAAASIGFMVSAHGFFTSTAFCYLIASMGILVLWSFGLACLDLHALRSKTNLQNPVLVSLFVVGDWVTAILSLAATCSSAGVTLLYSRDLDYCKSPQIPCSHFKASVLFAFVSWFLLGISSHVTFWLLAAI